MKTDETRLTAYILGEIRDPGNCQEIEEALRNDKDLRTFSDEIRQLQNGLTVAYQKELGDPLFFPAFTKAEAQSILIFEGHSFKSEWMPLLSSIAAFLMLGACLMILNKVVPGVDNGATSRPLPVGWISSTVAETSELLTGNWENDLDPPRSPKWKERSLWWRDNGSYLGYGMELNELKYSESPIFDSFSDPLSGFPLEASLHPFSQLEVALNRGRLPAPWDIHIESLVNSFQYEYPSPASLEEPFAVHLEQAISPWMNGHTLLRVGVQGYEIPWDSRVDSNLVFLVDVSGSMDEKNKLPLVKAGIQKLLGKLRAHERVAIVTYGGATEVVLPSTMVVNGPRIERGLKSLQPGGTSRMQTGIVEAYAIAKGAFIEGGNNRVIVCSDGDFSLGIPDPKYLNRLIARQANSGISLSAYGFAMDRGVSSPMAALARMGNGQYAYIDSLADSDQLFAGQVSGSIITIARDVTVEVDFNPSHVDAYRLIGYEAGIKTALGRSEEMPLLRSKIQPAGQSVTALFELIPADVANDPTSEGSSFAATNADTRGANVSDIVTVRVYYQHPNGSEAEPIEVPLADKLVPFEEASSDFRFAAAVAGFGQLLRNSQYKGDVTFDWVLSTARNALGHNEGGYRSTFVEMVEQAEAITYFDHPAADG